MSQVTLKLVTQILKWHTNFQPPSIHPRAFFSATTTTHSMDPWRTIPAHGDIPSYAYLTTSIEKSEQDNRDYRLIRLENGLQAVVVHDALAGKAAACLNVAVGNLRDPHDMLGMAHFCEHMLSKGSIPFPEENDFLSFITSNGGTRNATTKAAGTYYWFSIGPDLLFSALPRLAAFFNSPLFSPSMTAREMNAVDSENKKNLQNDDRRAFQLTKSLSIPGHPWTKFGTGNIDSLTEAARKLEKDGCLPLNETETAGDGGPVGRETRRRLVEWWKKEYCAGRMTLAVVAKEPLDELASLVAKCFSPIANLGIDPRPAVTQPCWGPKEMGTVVFLKTVKDSRSLSLTFQLPYQQPHYRSKPADFVSHLLGHEGPGSIYAYLKKQGWIVSLSAGAQTWNRGVQTFQICATLTILGLSHYSDVLLTIYNYIGLLRSSPLATYLHEEVQRLRDIRFRFLEKTEPHTYATFLAEELAEPYPLELLLSAATIIQDWDEMLVREMLKIFVPECGRVMLKAKEHTNVPLDAEWETERWYGAQYRVQRLDDAILTKAREPNLNHELFLPRPNQFIPENFEVQQKSVSEPFQQPTCIRETPLSTLWHKVDDQFCVPKAHVKVDIRSPLAYATPRHAVLTRILANLVEDALAVVTYDAQLAGLGYSLTAHSDGLLISLSGFNDKLPVLMRTVISMMKDLVVDPHRFAVITEQLKLEYENFYLDNPYVIANYRTSCLLMATIWSPAEKLVELLHVTQADVCQHKEELLSRIHIESLVNGNFNSQETVDLVSVAEELLAAQPLALSERFSDRSLILPEGANFVKQEAVADPKELNSCLSYYCHFGDIGDSRLRPILDMIVHTMRAPCFSQLRTTEQLGYIVSSAQSHGPGSMGLRIVVQSLRDPEYLEERVDVFFDTFRRNLESLSDQELETQKEGLIVKKLERLKNLRQETSRFWDHISSGYYNFRQHETDAATIRKLSLREILDAYNEFVHPSSPTRRKLSVRLRSQNLEPCPPKGGAVIIEDEITFKARLGSSPSPVPVELIYEAHHKGTRTYQSQGNVSKSRL